jgi:hypothetical protein
MEIRTGGSPNVHAHNVPRESHELIPCGHFVGFFDFFCQCAGVELVTL